MAAYYNEIDPYAAQWLRNLIAGGVIAPGYVDERSIEDVRPDELREFTQCHFFAGVGVWSYALRRAGWPDDRPVWSGSCPCQPFSAAGKGGAFTDERHLWPAWYHLITQRQPGVVFGEQVASKPGLAWLDLIQTDLEGAGYASGALDICAAGVGSPNIRQRSWFVAERLADLPGTGCGIVGRGGLHSPGEAGPHVDDSDALSGLADSEPGGQKGGQLDPPENGGGPGDIKANTDDGAAAPQLCPTGGLADTEGGRRRKEQPDARRIGAGADTQEAKTGGSGAGGDSGGLDDSASSRHEREIETTESKARDETRLRLSGTGHGQDTDGQPGPTNGIWGAVDWLYCRDGKWRPVRPGTFPLVNGAPSRVGRLRAYGNAINAKAAEEFIRAYREVTK